MDLPTSTFDDNWRHVKYARKEHRCTYCGGPIVYWEAHVLHQMGVNATRTERYHNACAVNVLASRLG